MSKKKAAAEKARLEAALKAATDDARRMYTTHERERRSMETADKTSNDLEQFDRIRERQRLQEEKEAYATVEGDIEYLTDLALVEARKHERWHTVTQASWLPDVEDEGQIAAFLARWTEEQETTLGMMDAEKTVHMHTVTTVLDHATDVRIENMTLQRLDALPLGKHRKRRTEIDLNYCVHAVRLAESISRASDIALMRGDRDAVDRHSRHLRMVHGAILSSLDRLTCLVGHNVDVFTDPEDDIWTRRAPSEADASEPLIKYGLWLRTNDKRIGLGASIMYQNIAIFIEPKDSSTVRLPRAMGLAQNASTTVRAMQLSFDPCSVNCKPGEGQRFIALDCILALESIMLPEKMKKVGDWNVRTESTTAPSVHRNDYPPRKSDKGEFQQQDELMMKVTFELPKTVAIRSNNIKIGKWSQKACQWEHIAIATLTQEALRRFAFLTTDLTTLAVIQDKGHEVPYESWRITPLADDEAMFYLQGKLPDETGAANVAREVQILVREDQCKLVAPEDPELAHLRASWLSPPTLMRLLSKAGYNFLLNDEDGFTMPHVLTKTKELESKGYHDIALFASRFAVASSRHNKAGEDPDMALFRLSRARRPDDLDVSFEPNPVNEGEWNSVRYESSRCVLAQFREADEDAVLSPLPGHDTHLNLFKCLEADIGEDEVKSIVRDGNPLLRQGLFTLLNLVRPFSWG